MGRERQDIHSERGDAEGCLLLILGGTVGIGATALMIGIAIGIATGNFPPSQNDYTHEPTPTPKSQSTIPDSFEHSLDPKFELISSNS